jgi:hypothetical protein
VTVPAGLARLAARLSGAGVCRTGRGRRICCAGWIDGGLLLALLAVTVCAAFGPVPAAQADGSLPPLPYRYLHPPPALAKNNKRPLDGVGSFPTRNGVSPQLKLFTRDGLTGVVARPGSLRVATGKRIRITIRPVNAPSGLPGIYVVDGNAYTVMLQAEPDNGPVTTVRPFNLVFRWPHIPTAIYMYRGSWKRVCYSDQGTLSGFTLSCHARSSGLYAAAAPPPTSTIKLPAPIAHSWFSRVVPYIPFIAAILLLLVTSVVLYIMVWPREPAEERPGK